ncbi:MAG: DUF4134 family protein [Capnocytophaga sp.]|nr:DUF4134 family protein [Capnocytophaga sp.]
MYFTTNQTLTRRKIILLFVLGICVSAPVLAQGAGAITDAANSIKTYWGPLKNLIMMIGGIVGLIGGLRIYNKWTNGDQDINKEILGWGGACLFLILVPIFVGAFFALD